MAATVIDALLITLGLDIKDYERNQKQAGDGLDKFKKDSDSTAKNVVEGGKKIAEGFASIRNQLIGLLAVATAGRGLKNFITDGVTGMAELGRHAANLDMTPRQLDAWGAAAESVGGSAGDMQKSLQSLAGGIEEFKLTGQSSMMPVLMAMKVAITDANGKLKPYSDLMLAVADSMQKMSKQDALFFGHQLGFDDHTIYLLEKGRSAVASLRDEMERSSGVTDKTVEDAQRLQAQWASFDRQVQGLRDTLFSALEPALRPIIAQLSEWVRKNHDLIATRITEWVGRFVAWLPGFIKQLLDIASNVDRLVESFGGWKSVAIVLGGILALKVLSPVTGLILGLARLIPMLGSTAAGFASIGTAALGVGAAIAGWKIGSAISDKLDGTRIGDSLGHYNTLALGHIMSLFGDDSYLQAAAYDGYAQKYQGAAQLPGQQDSQGSSSPKGSSKAPRGLRNNNPGNLNYAGQRGAHLETSANPRFAAFDSIQDGIAALVRQLGLYASRGIDTIEGIVKKYAPQSDGNDVSAYIKALSGAMGKNGWEHLDLSDPSVLVPLIQGIVRHEGNGTLGVSDIMKGIQVGAQQKVASRINNSSVTHTSAETHIAKIEVQTSATDAKGIAAAIGPEIRRNSLVAMSANGLDG